MPRTQAFGLSSRFRENCAAVALALAIFGTGLCDPAQAKIIKFDPPGSTSTYASGINASRSVIGTYYDSN